MDDVETIDLGASQRSNTGTCTILRITDAGQDQQLTTDGSRRVLIVHVELIKLGFVDYVARRRAEGAERLFDLTRSSNEKWTKELSRQLNRYLDATVMRVAGLPV